MSPFADDGIYEYEPDDLAEYNQNEADDYRHECDDLDIDEECPCEQCNPPGLSMEPSLVTCDFYLNNELVFSQSVPGTVLRHVVIVTDTATFHLNRDPDQPVQGDTDV